MPRSLTRSLELFWVSFPAENSYSRRDFQFQANLAAHKNILLHNPLIYILSIAHFWFHNLENPLLFESYFNYKRKKVHVDEFYPILNGFIYKGGSLRAKKVSNKSLVSRREKGTKSRSLGYIFKRENLDLYMKHGGPNSYRFTVKWTWVLTFPFSKV